MAGLKTYWQTYKYRIAQRQRLMLAGVALLAFSVWTVPACAQDGSAGTIDLASLTLLPLPNQSIATIKGNGLQVPSAGNNLNSNGSITLWDELKMPAQQQNGLSGSTVITINGVTK